VTREKKQPKLPAFKLYGTGIQTVHLVETSFREGVMDGFHLRPHIDGWLVQWRSVQVVDLSNRRFSSDRRCKEVVMIDWWAGAGGTGSAFSHRWGRVMAHALQVALWHLNVSLRLLAFSHGLNLDAIVMSIFPATLVLTRLKLPPSMPPCKVCFMTSSIRSCPIPSHSMFFR
jgi:hypothetical protein